MLRIGDDGIDISWMRTALSVYRSVFTFFFFVFLLCLEKFQAQAKLSVCLFFFFPSFFLSGLEYFHQRVTRQSVFQEVF